VRYEQAIKSEIGAYQTLRGESGVQSTQTPLETPATFTEGGGLGDEESDLVTTPIHDPARGFQIQVSRLKQVVDGMKDRRSSSNEKPDERLEKVCPSLNLSIPLAKGMCLQVKSLLNELESVYSIPLI